MLAKTYTQEIKNIFYTYQIAEFIYFYSIVKRSHHYYADNKRLRSTFFRSYLDGKM